MAILQRIFKKKREKFAPGWRELQNYLRCGAARLLTYGLFRLLSFRSHTPKSGNLPIEVTTLALLRRLKTHLCKMSYAEDIILWLSLLSSHTSPLPHKKTSLYAFVAARVVTKFVPFETNKMGSTVPTYSARKILNLQYSIKDWSQVGIRQSSMFSATSKTTQRGLRYVSKSPWLYKS